MVCRLELELKAELKQVKEELKYAPFLGNKWQVLDKKETKILNMLEALNK